MHVRMAVLYPAYEVHAYARTEAPVGGRGWALYTGPFMRPAADVI